MVKGTKLDKELKAKHDALKEDFNYDYDSIFIKSIYIISVFYGIIF